MNVFHASVWKCGSMLSRVGNAALFAIVSMYCVSDRIMNTNVIMTASNAANTARTFKNIRNLLVGRCGF